MKLSILPLAGLLIVSANFARADDESEVIRAQAYIGLADELSKSAEEVANEFANSLDSISEQIVPESPNFSYTAEQQALFEQHNILVSEAKGWYLKIFARDYGLSGGEAFSLPLGYQFLKRDAFEKWNNLDEGFLVGGNRRKNANLYSVNADFKADLISKTSSLVTELQRLDTEARRIEADYNQFRVSQSDANGNAIGIDQAKLQAANYSVRAQSQLQQYLGQSKSLAIQLVQEAKNITAKRSIAEKAKQIFQIDWSKLMDVDAISEDVPTPVEVYATSNTFTTAVTGLTANTVLSIRAEGVWKARGSSKLGCYGPNTLCWTTYDASTNQTSWVSLTRPNFAQRPLSAAEFGMIFAHILNGTVQSDANGIFVSFSDGVSESEGESENIGMGVSIEGIGISGGKGSSSSSGRSLGQSMTLGFKSGTSDYPEANIGALLGKFTGAGLSPGESAPFVVGTNLTMKVPSSATGPVTLSFMQNDIAGQHNTNEGFVTVVTTKTVQFANYMEDFSDWLNRDCTVNPETGARSNCGFLAIAKDLPFSSNPQLLAESATDSYLNQFEDVPARFRSLLLGAVKSTLSTAIAMRDIELAFSQYEQSAIAKNTAEASADLAKQEIANTAELVSLIEKQANSSRRTTALIAAGKDFYEGELANIDTLRKYVIARLQRYLQITYESYNYRYLSDLGLAGNPQPGFEGNFYNQALQTLVDQMADDDANNDTSNPNRGFLVYQLPEDRVEELKATGKTSFKLAPEDFYCQGYGIEDQVRIHIEKVGYLLDIDPANEQNFFNNVNIRRMALRTTHGNANTFHDLVGKIREYYVPTQTKEIYGYSTRVLTDYHSDYTELGDSPLFSRRSFRNTAYVADWQTQILDLENYNLEHLNGLKFVVYFSSTEALNDTVLKICPEGRIGRVQRGRWN